MVQLGPDDKRMKLRYAGSCRLCGRAHGAGAEAIYERARKAIRCVECDKTAVEAPRSKSWAAKPVRPRAESTSDAGMPVSSGSAVSIQNSAG